MNITRAFMALVMLLMVNIAGLVSAQEKLSGAPAIKHNIIIPPMRFVSPDDKKLWEGEIKGRVTAYFRLEKESRISEVVVITQDELPEYFKRIEYLDNGGDGNLDLMSMKIYEKDKGWRDIGITKDNKYGLAYADSHYKELLEKIKEAGKAKK
ncbi:MAG: hypothetical protein HY757_09130 [Nitrospirae bacterium]|nr:hypothetical protein [Nitrospirota bacterium]